MMVERVSRLWLMNFASLARIPLLFVILALSEPARSTRFRVETRIGTSTPTSHQRRQGEGERRWERVKEGGAT
jgi:hypothetical protein